MEKKLTKASLKHQKLDTVIIPDKTYVGHHHTIQVNQNSGYKSYSEKLKDPRWQKKRLKIFERDNFACRQCKNTEKNLAVHHVKYIKGNEPWDYPDYLLITLCDDCHLEYEELLNTFKSSFQNTNSPFRDYNNLIWVLAKLTPPEITRLTIYIATNMSTMQGSEAMDRFTSTGYLVRSTDFFLKDNGFKSTVWEDYNKPNNESE